MLTSAVLEGLFAHAVEAALVVNESGIILFASDRACHLLKYAPGELDGVALELLVPGRFRLGHVGHRLRFTDERRTRVMGAGRELFALCKDGSERRVEVSLHPVQRGMETFTVATLQVRESDEHSAR